MCNILGFSFSDLNMSETVQHLNQIVDEQNQYYHVVTANPEIVMNGLKDTYFNQILMNSSLITPDGIGIVIASKIFNTPLSERVTGFDLINELFKYRTSHGKQTRIYALGSDKATIKQAVHRIQESYPSCEIVGYHHGFYLENSREEVAIMDEIVRLQPQILLVGLGSPKQEYFIHKLKEYTIPTLAIGVGGSFDVFGGKVNRAPIFFQKIGLEWFYRLVQQPSRFKRQFYLFQFMLTVLRRRFL